MDNKKALLKRALKAGKAERAEIINALGEECLMVYKHMKSRLNYAWKYSVKKAEKSVHFL